MGEKNAEHKIKYTVEFGKTFTLYYSERYSKKTIDKIDDFIEHYEEFGLSQWKGKISPSDRVPETYADRTVRIQKAQTHNLWHVHIGEPNWKESFHGKYLVSDWVLHFKKIDNYTIMLLELSCHDPMELPSDELLTE